MAFTSACGPPYTSCQPSPSTDPSRTRTAPTRGFGCTRPRPLPASSTARCRYCASMSVSTGTSFSLRRACTVPEPVHGHVRAGPRVGQRVEVERPVEVEGHRPAPLRVRRRVKDDVRASLQLPVVRDGSRNLLGLGLRTAALGRADDDPAVPLALED